MTARRDVTAARAGAATIRWRRPVRSRRAARRRRRSTSTPTRPAPTASSRPPTLVAGRRGRRRPAPRPDRPRHARRLPRGRRRGRRPGRPDARSRASRSTPSSPATSGCGRASSTSSASGWTPTTRRSRRPSPPSAGAAASGSSGPSRGCASSTCRSTTTSLDVRARDDDALGRPTVARALIAAGLRDERRGRLPPAARLGHARLRAAQRARPGRGDRGDPGRRRAAGAGPFQRGARERSTSSASSRRRASAGWRSTTARSTRPTVFAVGEVARGARPRRRPAAATTTATSSTYAEAHAGLWVPPEVGRRHPGRAGSA